MDYKEKILSEFKEHYKNKIWGISNAHSGLQGVNIGSAYTDIYEELEQFISDALTQAEERVAEEIDKDFARLFTDYKLGSRDTVYFEFHELLKSKYLKK